MSTALKLSAEQERVITSIRSGRNILITGSAGTGKSTILRALMAEYGPDLPVTASTGIAAVGVGGTTLHSWAGLGKGEDTPEQIAKAHIESHGKAYKRIKKAKQLAIDEVSMIHSSLFDMLDHVFQAVRQNTSPFGGIQLILFGDFLQLPPVSRDTEGTQFAFHADSWKRANIHVALLTQIFRQDDVVFAAALNQIRVGNLTPEIRRLLASRYRKADPSPEVEAVTVYTHNEDVDKLNGQRLAQIEAKEEKWDAIDWGEPGPLRTLQSNCLAPAELRLKVGAQVMLLWNLDTEAGLANGSLGTVKEWNKKTGYPVVKFVNGEERTIEPKAWEIKIGGEILASRRQVPLRLAWAITAHKSQGMTLDKIKVHLHRVFDYGQAYVALSRARTLEGLHIESSKEGCIRAHPAAIEFYEQAAPVEGPAELTEGTLL